MQTAATFAAIFAGIVLVLMIMFRWSGFISRVIALVIGLGVFSSVLVMHIINNPTMSTTFVMIYGGFIAVILLLSILILFKGR